MVDFSHHHRHPQSKRQNQRRQDRELQQTRWAHRLLWRRRVNRHHLRPPPAKLKVTPRSRSPATLPGKPPPAKTKTQPLPWPAAGSNANVWDLVSASKQQTKKITHTPPGQQSTNKKVRIQEDAVMKPSPKIPGTVARTTQGESTVSPAATQYYPPGPSGASPAGTVYYPPSPSSRHGGSQGPTPIQHRRHRHLKDFINNTMAVHQVRYYLRHRMLHSKKRQKEKRNVMMRIGNYGVRK